MPNDEKKKEEGPFASFADLAYINFKSVFLIFKVPVAADNL